MSKLKLSNGSTSKGDNIPEAAKPELPLIAHRPCALRDRIDAAGGAACDSEAVGHAVVVISEKKGVLAMCKQLAVRSVVLQDRQTAGIEGVTSPVVDRIVDGTDAQYGSAERHTFECLRRPDILPEGSRSSVDQSASARVGLDVYPESARDFHNPRTAKMLDRIIKQPNAQVEGGLIEDKPVFLKCRDQIDFYRLIEFKACS